MDCLLGHMASQGRGKSCPLCRHPMSTDTVKLESTGEPLAPPTEAQPFWGSVYVQRGGVGVASYHFESPEVSYISYSAAPATWRRDDGSRPPAKKPFENASWDPDERVFRGEITWNPPFHGDTHWTYEMNFAEDLETIVGGTVTKQDGNADMFSQVPGYGLMYHRTSPMFESPFGAVFVKSPAKIYIAVQEGRGSLNLISADDCRISFERLAEEEKFDDGSDLPSEIAMTELDWNRYGRVLMGEVDFGDHTFQGAKKWEIELTFDEGFAGVKEGEMFRVMPDGARVRFESYGEAGPSTRLSQWVRKP
mmetsp:Transcript_26727/g.40548  ORF Transcript_26727/g.40548 Transcript_26727/m.40548 type:complete len:307 (+) Transcript_26727:3-923(+)